MSHKRVFPWCMILLDPKYSSIPSLPETARLPSGSFH